MSQETLYPKLEDNNGGVRTAAVQALGALTGTFSDVEGHLDSLYQFMLFGYVWKFVKHQNCRDYVSGGHKFEAACLF